MLSLFLFCLVLAINTTHALHCVLVLTAFHTLHLVAFAVAIDWCTSVLAWHNVPGGDTRDTDSKIELDESDRAAVVSTMKATASSLAADSTLDVDSAVASIGVKNSYKLSDLTYFDAFSKARKA